MNKSSVRAYWYSETTNVGDNLTSIILKYLSGKDVELSYEHGRILSIGSVIEFIQDGDVVWGSGLIQSMVLKKKESVKFLVVRGALTRERLLASGYDVPAIYGDPAILMSEIYHPTVKKEHRTGLIPHYIEKDAWTDNGFYIDILSGVYSFINNLLKCETIITSSLHAYILAQAYGITATYCQKTDRIIGGFFKFKDYQTSNTSAEELKKLIKPYL